MNYLLHAVIVGTLATVVMDLWTTLRRHWLGVAGLDYALLGRWVGHLARGQFRHAAIAQSAPVAGERLLGLATHYLIGITFAALLLAIWGAQWLQHPTLAPALIIGIATVVAPFLILQPAMGAGIAAARTPAPAKARMHSLITHTIYGLGLFLAGWIDHLLFLR